MTIASSSREQLAYTPEVTFGVLNPAGTTRYLRMTGESLSYEITKQTSEEINNTRSVSSMIPVTASASGSVDTEISYREYDVLLEAALQNDFEVFGTLGVSDPFTANFTVSTITASAATSGASDFTLLKPGQFFRLEAPGHANHGKILRNSLTVAATDTILTVDPSTPLTVGLGVALCTIATSRLTNGVNQRSFSIERQNPDISEYWAYLGQTLSSMEVNLATGSRSTFAFNFMGKKAVRNTSSNLPGPAVDSYTHDIHSGSTGPVCLLWVDGAPLTGTYVTSVKLTYDNALRSQEALCELGAVGIGSGTISLTGSMEVYFSDGDLFDKFSANESIELTFSTLDNLGNGYIFVVPKANISKVDTQAGSKDQDMMLSLDFSGLRDSSNANPSLRQVLFIDRVGSELS